MTELSPTRTYWYMSANELQYTDTSDIKTYDEINTESTILENSQGVKAVMSAY